MIVAVPTLPPAGTTLGRDTTVALAADLDAWVSTIASQLVDLDAEAQGSGTDAQRADVAAAFALWRAVSERAAEWDDVDGASAARRAELLAAAWQPLRTDDGEVVASDLADGLTFLDALVARLGGEIATTQQQAVTATNAWITLDTDLRAAEQAAARLGQEVRHVADLVAAAARSPRSMAPPSDLAARAAEAKARLDGAELERDRLLNELDGAAATRDELAERERSVRVLAATCREKIAGAPNLAVPSVAAIGAPPADARDRPWPAVQADVRAHLRLLERTAAALDEATRRFQAPLTRRDELRGLLQAYRDKADDAGLAEHERLDPAYTAARDTLWSAPCPVDEAERQVQAYIATVNSMIHGAR